MTRLYNHDVGLKTAIDWDAEVAALQDLSMTAGRSHALAAEALLDAYRRAADRDGGPLDQKILLGKLAAEFVSALEDLAALGWAIRRRRLGGALRQYLGYGQEHVRAFYRCARQMPAHQLLSVPAAEQIGRYVDEADCRAYAHDLGELQRVLKPVAGIYLGADPDVVRAYNKLKHGFVVIVRLDKLRPGAAPPGDWRNAVNIVTDVTTDAALRYTALENSAKQVEYFIRSIQGVCGAARGLVDLVQFLWERGVRLDWRVPKNKRSTSAS